MTDNADGPAEPGASAMRCAVYARSATNVRPDSGGMSVYEQRDACLRFICSMPNWQALALTYLDVGFSGADIDRPALQRLVVDIMGGAVDIVVVHDLDRLTRSPLDFCALAHLFREADVGLVIVADGAPAGEPTGTDTEREPSPEEPS